MKCEHCKFRQGRKLPMDFRAQFHEAHEYLCSVCVSLLIRKVEQQDDFLVGYVDFGPKPLEAIR